MAPEWECERCRELASVELDGPLPSLESARLRRHLRRCAACRRYAGDVRGFTHLLRSAPLEQPARRVELPERRRRARVVALSAAAAALAAAATFSVPGLGGAPAPGAALAATTPQADFAVMRVDRWRELRKPATANNAPVRAIETD